MGKYHYSIENMGSQAKNAIKMKIIAKKSKKIYQYSIIFTQSQAKCAINPKIRRNPPIKR